jgi:peptidoglycan/LPS O-acetylase OafA/YrhL
MNDSQPKRRIGRSILAGLAGILTAVVPTIAADALIHATSLYPPAGETIGDAPFILATIYRTVFGLAAGYVTARLAPYRPMAHSLVLGAVGTLVAIIGTVVTWNKGPDFGPHWYPLALVVLGMPQSWAGARLRELQLRSGTTTEERTRA